MANEQDRLLPADYDGIREYDNPIPLWLNLVFIGSIVFAVIYIAYYHVLGIGTLPREAYAQEMEAAQELRGELQEEAAQVDLMALTEDADALAAGSQIYATNCAACHGQNAEGQIGPNLKDQEWVHGGSVEAIAATVQDGVLDKGMPAWGPVLGPEKVNQVSAYVYSLRFE